MPLGQAAAAVETMLRLSAARGVTHARLTLSPQELGGIDVRLRYTAAGLTATILTDAPQAAQVLQHAADGLRRALEDHGVALLSMEIGARSDGTPFAGRGASGERDSDPALPQDEERSGVHADDHDRDPEQPLAVLPGALVDVRA